MNTKKILRIVPLLLLVLSLTNCADQAAPEAEVQEVGLINPIGPAVIPVAGLLSGDISGDVNINLQYWKTADEAIGFLSADGPEFAVLPITNGVNMSAAGLDLTLLGVHEWKVFYLIASAESQFSDWNSLTGKTVYTPGAKGQTVDVLTRYALLNEGITPDEEVSFAYAPGAEIVALFQEGKVDFAALPEPFVTQALASSNGRIVMDYQEYWTEVSGGQDGIPIAGLFVKSDFLSKHPETVNQVVDLLAESTKWAKDNADAAVSAASEVLPLPSDIMLAALQRIKFEYISAADSKEQVLQFLQTMQDTYPDGIKMIPEDSFFAAE